MAHSQNSLGSAEPRTDASANQRSGPARREGSVRPAHVYANLSDRQYHELVNALHQQWRVATRAVMILLSANGMTATEIGALLHYDPRTVRRWITRHDRESLAGLPDRPRSGRPRLGERVRALLATPKAWTIVRIWRRWDARA